MKRVLLVLAVVALSGLGAVPSTSAQEGPSRPDHSGGMSGGMGGMMGGGMMMEGGPAAERPLISLALQNRDQLGLTADQVTQLESLRAEFQKEAIRRSADIQVADTELAELLGAEPVDLPKVEAKLRQLEGLRVDFRLSRIRTLEKGKALLTPDQRKKLTSLGPRASLEPREGMAGMAEMDRFMRSQRMPRAMAAMMGMARQMGDGDPMAGMVRMMEMMSTMGQMGGGPDAQPGGHMGGMMSPRQPRVSP